MAMPARFLLTALLIIATDCAIAAESAYIGGQHFMPLPQRGSVAGQRNIGNAQQKFFPLSASRYPAPARKENSDAELAREPKEIAAISPTSDKKNPMSQEQAKQILSIFAEAN